MQFSRRVPNLVASITFLIALLNILSNISGRFQSSTEILNREVNIYFHSTAFATSIFTGLLLLILSWGLRRRKKRAWLLTIMIIVLNLSTELFRYPYNLTQLGLSIFLLGVLIHYRDEFYAKSDPTTPLRPLFAFILTFIFLLIVGSLLYYFRHSSNISGTPSLEEVLLTVIEGFVWIAGPVRLTSKIAQQGIDLTLGLFGIFIILIPIATFLRRVRAIPPSTTEEKELAIELNKKFGDCDSLAYFATRDDKSIVWTRNRKAGIAYRVQSGVMLASGDPFGEYSLWSEAIDAFLSLSREFGWTPAIMGASETGGKLWMERAHFSAIEIGDEAIINVKEFSLDGRVMNNVRQTLGKAKRAGIQTHVAKVSELGESDRRIIESSAQSWRGGSGERGFSMSMDRFLSEIDGDALLVSGTLNGELVGFLYFLPWGKVGYSLDRMQRAPRHLPGLTEMLIHATIEYCEEFGFEHLSLNFAAFRSLIERAEKISAGPILRGTRFLLRLVSGWFQIESLYRFNAKFQPEWQARYLLYPGIGELSRVIWAALRAEKFIGSFGRRHIS
ncbi:MAG: DUF2156 domain-containing protein [Actinobacteria bacterium]|uniref:DUF2156 domain-containing protein n=1 Tax=Candidatus Fonsibacter lacus TaxID=2576439 RepID=A0A965LL16_9PROT|nr:DUF2156 domain-containing protein [Candidatus Fonsibacter lacus]